MEINFLKRFKKTELKKPVNKSYQPDILDRYDNFYTNIQAYNSTYNAHLSLLLYFFNNVSEVNSLVTYIAQKASDIPVKHVKILGNGKEKDLGQTWVKSLLNKPNPFNDGRAFLINSFSSYFIYGFIPTNKVESIGWGTSELFLLPGDQFYPIPLKSINQYGKPAIGVDFRTNPIVKYRMFIDAKPYDFDPSEIILMNDSSLSFHNGAYMLGQSRLYSAIRSIQSLSNIYDTVNSLLADKGAAGFLVKRSRPGEQDPGWDEDDKKEVERKLYSYGTSGGKKPIGVTTKDLGFIRLSVPVGEFMPIELKDKEFRTLASALMFPAVLLNDKDGAIYNNVSLAEKTFFTNCLQPVVNQYYQSLSTGLGLDKIGEALKADWSGIECLQSNRTEKAKGDKEINDKCKMLWDENMITRNQWLKELGMPENTNPDFNKFKNELKTQPDGIETN